MRPTRPDRCFGQGIRFAGPLLLALLLWACSEGYPGEDAPLISPFDMGNEQRLLALNEIGASAHPDSRWAFSLDEKCGLQMEHKRKGSRMIKQRFVLRQSMDVDLGFDKADKTFGVHLLADASEGAQRLGVLLESPAWTEASQAELLFQLLIRDCGKKNAD